MLPQTLGTSRGLCCSAPVLQQFDVAQLYCRSQAPLLSADS